MFFFQLYSFKHLSTGTLKDLTLSIDKGEFVSIVGPSGCGKTTILSLISGLLKPTAGKILVDNQKPNLKNTKCGYMFQKDNLLPWRTIEKNLYLGLEIQHKIT